MAITSPNRNDGNLAEIFLWWLILAIIAAAALLLPASRVSAQTTAGPMPAATPSDQPATSPRATAPAQIGGKPNLSGNWVLNKDASDDPREAMQTVENASGSRVRVGGGAGGGGGWGGRNGGGGGRGSQGGSNNMMNDLSQITIEQTASSAKVMGESGRVLALYSAADSSHANSSSGSSANSSTGTSTSSSTAPADSGKTGASESSGSSDESASGPPAAKWQGTQLIAVTQGRREGSTTTRTYELSPDGKQLYVTTKMVNPRFKSPVTFRLVYDPAPSGG